MAEQLRRGLQNLLDQCNSGTHLHNYCACPSGGIGIRGGLKIRFLYRIMSSSLISGTNLEIFGRLNEIEGLNIIASGGITFDDEIKTLRDMNIYAAIVGKAVYENKLDLARAVRIADGGAFD